MRRFSFALTVLTSTLLLSGCDLSRASSPVAAASLPASPSPAKDCSFTAGTCQLIEANDRMHAQMAVEWTGDVDVDFLQTMIPHHQGAVDMAKAVLAHGNDPKVKALAEAIVVAQEQEIAHMRQRIVELNAAEGGPRAPQGSPPPAAKPHQHH